jgi:hypothetical protein
MRPIINKLALIAATLIISALPVLADEGMINPANEPALEGGRNECLLVAMNTCPNYVDSITDRIERLKTELNKGTDVYTNDELKKLERDLDGITKDYENIISGG